jgi:hypothetical protein
MICYRHGKTPWFATVIQTFANLGIPHVMFNESQSAQAGVNPHISFSFEWRRGAGRRETDEVIGDQRSPQPVARALTAGHFDFGSYAIIRLRVSGASNSVRGEGNS